MRLEPSNITLRKRTHACSFLLIRRLDCLTHKCQSQMTLPRYPTACPRAKWGPFHIIISSSEARETRLTYGIGKRIATAICLVISFSVRRRICRGMAAIVGDFMRLIRRRCIRRRWNCWKTPVFKDISQHKDRQKYNRWRKLVIEATTEQGPHRR